MKTFVIRLFTPSDVEPHVLGGEVRGVVEEVGSDRRASFADSAELLLFLGEEPVAAAPTEGGTP